MARKTKAIKITSYKSVLRQIDAFQRNVAKGKEQSGKTIDALINKINAFRGKRGDISSSKMRSVKKKKEFNALIKQWKKNYGGKAKRQTGIQRDIKQNKISTFEENKNQTLTSDIYEETLDSMETIRKIFSGSSDDESESKRTIAKGFSEMKEFFQDELYNLFYRVAMLQEQVDDMSNKDALKMLFETIKKRKDNLPSLLEKYASADDRFNLIEKCIEILSVKEGEGETVDEEFINTLFNSLEEKAREGVSIL